MPIWEQIEREILTCLEGDKRTIKNPISDNSEKDAFYDGMYEAYKIMKKYIKESEETK